MKQLTKLTLVLLFGCPLVVLGCGDDDTGTDGGSSVDSGTDTDGGSDSGTDPDTGVADAGPPPFLGRDNPPVPGDQIDRAGRPAISSGAVGTFLPNDMETERSALKDAYNADSDPANWSTYAAAMATHIAVFDGLDEDCTNQILRTGPLDDQVPYTFLAGVLADDRLYIDSAQGICAAYLAVEADVTGVLANDDCGGRNLTVDVIDTTYSILVAGALAGVSDTIDADDATHSNDTFPFLAAPL